MLTRFVGFNWLAVCVAAVVSESKKAVSATAAAVVGVGLLCSPIESVQGQSSKEPATVNFVNLQFVDDYYYFGGTLESVDVDITDFGSWLDATKVQYSIYVESGYAVVTFNPVWPKLNISPLVHEERDDGWVEILVWLGDYFDFPSGSPGTWDAYVYDSTGACYEVDLFVEGVWVNGPGLFSSIP